MHYWNNDDITKYINNEDKAIIINYINQYHKGNLDINCSFEEIIKYSLDIFEKIKGNMECYLKELESIK